MFGYNQVVIAQFPTIRAGVVYASGVRNTESGEQLLVDYREQQAEVVTRFASIAIADIPSISAWRRVFARFGAKPTQHRNAAEALLRRLEKQGAIPSFSALVDLGNLVSIRYAMPVAVLDRSEIAGAIDVRLAAGDESFLELGAEEATQPDPGEVIFIDSDDVVFARRWCWRQASRGASGPNTVDAMFVIEGHHEWAEFDVTEAVAFLSEALSRHQPTARVRSFALSPVHQRIGPDE